VWGPTLTQSFVVLEWGQWEGEATANEFYNVEFWFIGCKGEVMEVEWNEVWATHKHNENIKIKSSKQKVLIKKENFRYICHVESMVYLAANNNIFSREK
jgi:hypothetical protein